MNIINPPLISDDLRQLAMSDNYHFRHDAALHPSCPLDVLVSLSKDVAPSVRFAVVWNPSTPIEVLCDLFRDEAPFVRCQVARHPSCPLNVIVALTEDGDPTVRDVAWREIEKRGLLGLILGDADG